MGFKHKVLGALNFLLGLAFVYVTVYMVDDWVAFMPDAFAKTLFWIGYISIIFVGIGFKSYMLLIKDDNDTSPIGSLYGYISFPVGCLLTIILYNIISVMLDVVDLSSTLDGILWFGYIIIVFLAVVVIPIYHAIEEPEYLNNMIGA